MSAAARLAGFSLLLVLLFGGAAFAGGAIGPDRDGERPDAAHGGGHAAEAPAAEADTVRGLAVSDDGVTLALEQTELARARAAELRFGIVDAAGERVRDFEVEHEKRMHLIVVRRDGQGFQHLHPELGGDGVWRTRLTLPDAGAYRVFADFKRGGKAQTLAADLTVDGAAGYEPLPEPAATADTGDGYDVRLDAGRVRAGRDAELRFTVSRDGETVHTEPYLGAGGHLVALREGDLAYLHVHPGGHDEAAGHDDAVAFASEFPSAGRYRLFLQFKHEGNIHTAEFTQEVAR